jgi:N-acetylglutamate synthase-like GNAT family acetyltransferase
MNVRRATGEEVAAVVALARESFTAAVAPLYGEEGKRTFMEFATAEAMRRRMSENYVTYVAHRDGELAGMAHVRDGCHVAMLFVKPQAQRSGIGRQLIEYAVAECTSDIVTVASTPNSESAYLRFGFERVAEERVDRGIRFIMMARNRKQPNQHLEEAP